MLILLTAMSSSCFAATETDSKLLKKWLALEQQSGALKQNWAERKLRLQQPGAENIVVTDLFLEEELFPEDKNNKLINE